MATPNNFKVTDAIGSTDNFAGAEVKFFHITLIQSDSSVLDTVGVNNKSVSLSVVAETELKLDNS